MKKRAEEKDRLEQARERIACKESIVRAYHREEGRYTIPRYYSEDKEFDCLSYIERHTR